MATPTDSMQLLKWARLAYRLYTVSKKKLCVYIITITNSNMRYGSLTGGEWMAHLGNYCELVITSSQMCYNSGL